MRGHVRSLALAACLLQGCGTSATAGDAPRLVLLYAPCTVSKEYLGPYAPDVSFTPNLDAFAAESVVFERHQSESGQSGIAFASIFSGTQAYVHGVYTHPRELPEELYLLTEAFLDAGYEPFFWSGHPMAAHELGYAQGVPDANVFDLKPPDRRRKKLGFLQEEDALFQRVLARLADDPAYKAVLVVSFTVTHGLYHMQLPRPAYREFLRAYPEESEGLTLEDLERQWELYKEHRFDLQWDFPGAVARIPLTQAEIERLSTALEVTYRADMAALDAMFGATLEQLRVAGVLDETLIAFTADHGETLYREGTLFKWTHGLQLAPEVLGVPWIVRAPGRLAPGRYAGVTRSIDVYPTLAGLCGIDLSGHAIGGNDLSAALLGGADPVRQLAYSHTTTIGPLHEEEFRSWDLAARFWGSTDPELLWVSVRDGDTVVKWRNLDGETWGAQVFNLAQDPHEAHDWYDPGDAGQAEVVRRLQAYKHLLVERFGGAPGELPPDAEERLRDLGYVE